MLDDDLIQNGPAPKPLLYKIAIGIYLIPLSLAFIGFFPIGMYSEQSFLYGMFFSVPTGVIGFVLSLIGFFQEKKSGKVSSLGTLLMVFGAIITIIGLMLFSLLILALGMFT
jgi:hypothetical protein